MSQDLRELTARVDSIDKLMSTKGGYKPKATADSFQEELMRLKKRVDIVSANVLGTAEEVSYDEDGVDLAIRWMELPVSLFVVSHRLILPSIHLESPRSYC